ncbi:MAG: bis-aminopropyl spermidine synthase family protein [Candidatus Woesearchaeota archaeon]|jgi:predicted methyltransferase|nr:bis-aminopropyl spermidine synthase family protein [Candidatus Woesearchaeota archaeon]
MDIGGEDNNNPIFKEVKSTPFRKFDDIAAELKKKAFPKKIIIHGGEFTIHPDFFKIISFIIGHGCDEIIIKTNGRMLSNSKFSDKLKNFNKITYLIEIYSADEKFHDKISRVKGSFIQTASGIKNISKFENEINILIPIIEENKKEITSLLNNLKDFDISNIIFYLPENTNKRFFYNGSFLMDLKEEISKFPEEIQIQLGFENIPFCLILNNDFYQQKNIFSNIGKVFDKKCSGCNKNNFCLGFSKDTLKQLNQSFIKPFTDTKSQLIRIHNNINIKSVIKISLDEIYKIMHSCHDEIDIWKCIYKLGYPIPLFLIVVEELKNEGLIKENRNTIKSNVRISNPKKIMDKSHKRFESDPKACQLLVSQEDIEKRIEYIKKTCISPGNIAVLGDDDFFSVNIANTGIFEKIYVFEIDKRIVNEINSIAKENNLPIICIQHDLRKRFLKKYLNKFDAIYTDSPYSPNGFSLFISRSIDLLKNQPHKHIFSSFSCEMPVIDVEMMVQNIINKMELFIERKSMPAANIIPEKLKEKFGSFEKLNESVYKNNKNLSELEKWYLSALGRKEFLFHFITTENTKPAIKGEFNEEIYYEDIPFDFYTNPEIIKKLK